jgi:MoaA/NifB/PqqE/SkfB family radical SAM enzyme
VAVSLDGADAGTYEAIRGGASFETVTGNVRRLASLRVDGRPRIALNLVMMPENVDQLEAMVRLAADLGADQVNFKQCDVVRGDHGCDRGLFAAGPDAAVRRCEKLLGRARRLARKLGVETTAFSFTPEELPVCDQDPRDSLFIRHDGRVAPCINQAYGGEICFLGEKAEMPEVHYGSLPADDLFELWQGALCRSYRETFAGRVAAHDRELVSGHFSSLDQLQRTYEEARKAMPAPPRGCSRCHYLYDI